MFSDYIGRVTIVAFFVCNISSRYCHLNISNVTFTIYSEGGILMNIFAKRIKELRQNSGLSQKELSYILNIERTTLTGYETGRRMPDAEMICSVADYFHISVDFFLGHEGDLNRPHIIKKDVQINEI